MWNHPCRLGNFSKRDKKIIMKTGTLRGIVNFPKIEPLEVAKKHGIAESRRILINKFFKSQGFQELCSKNRKIHPGSLVQISFGEESKPYFYGNDGVIDDFQLNILPLDGIFDFKTNEIVRNRHFYEKRIFFAATYLIIKEEGEWKGDLLLEDDGFLNLARINEAFLRIAEVRNKTITRVGKWYKIQTVIEDKPVETMATVAEMVSPSGKKILICCLADNGRIVTTGVRSLIKTPLDITYGRMVKTKFNWFICQDHGKLVRRK